MEQTLLVSLNVLGGARERSSGDSPKFQPKANFRFARRIESCQQVSDSEHKLLSFSWEIFRVSWLHIQISALKERGSKIKKQS